MAKLPAAMGALARALPAAALSGGLHAALGTGTPVPVESWVVLGGVGRGGTPGRRPHLQVGVAPPALSSQVRANWAAVSAP